MAMRYLQKREKMSLLGNFFLSWGQNTDCFLAVGTAENYLSTLTAVFFCLRISYALQKALHEALHVRFD
jgi:hypothetical protein